MKIVITELNWPQGIENLKSFAEVTYDPELWKNRDDLLSKVADADAVIVRNQTKVDQELLAHAPRLKVIGRLGVGLDNIDLEAARNAEIPVITAKNANAISVAEYVLSTMLIKSRNFFDVTASVKQGEWKRRDYTGEEIYGKTLGFIGMGEIGARLATRAKALGMNLLGYDPFVAPFDYPFQEIGIQESNFESVLSNSDFITIHVPFNKHTKDLISAEQLTKMKPGSVLINTSRGGIVNEEDLYTHLKTNSDCFAVLDVFAEEPPPQNHSLFELDNVFLTPHVSGLTEQSQERTSVMVSEEVQKELEGIRSLCRV
ncbi:D-3-phosphoglycerate dehydrogenase/(S)-sulfolactate dehydrogenase [Salsuginibacillus halophilus]|uniref:D-3-phosphoglycerate dehydrogenase/(S)-sulfolactate dehydrogenase n=1 Tax=Salsuginibacillus halophilus TaxID=517424 RepID=A0A2P8HL13_9BACI|nr:hydroxyacid dehydrogenase [Salsuginibacillus halophilus]PSL46896.1 D-3-phosphoglycerate dehydrogenase/(S)-sulfolactate dehydrogenase [Salsuginibacillus halophilus]